MKTAVSSNGKIVTASHSAPARAICPTCGGVVLLRARKLMANAGNSYYWHHLDGDHPCRRQKPFIAMRFTA